MSIEASTLLTAQQVLSTLNSGDILSVLDVASTGIVEWVQPLDPKLDQTLLRSPWWATSGGQRSYVQRRKINDRLVHCTTNAQGPAAVIKIGDPATAPISMAAAELISVRLLLRFVPADGGLPLLIPIRPQEGDPMIAGPHSINWLGVRDIGSGGTQLRFSWSQRGTHQVAEVSIEILNTAVSDVVDGHCQGFSGDKWFKEVSISADGGLGAQLFEVDSRKLAAPALDGSFHPVPTGRGTKRTYMLYQGSENLAEAQRIAQMQHVAFAVGGRSFYTVEAFGEMPMRLPKFTDAQLAQRDAEWASKYQSLLSSVTNGDSHDPFVSQSTPQGLFRCGGPHADDDVGGNLIGPTSGWVPSRSMLRYMRLAHALTFDRTSFSPTKHGDGRILNDSDFLVNGEIPFYYELQARGDVKLGSIPGYHDVMAPLLACSYNYSNLASWKSSNIQHGSRQHYHTRPLCFFLTDMLSTLFVAHIAAEATLEMSIYPHHQDPYYAMRKSLALRYKDALAKPHNGGDYGRSFGWGSSLFALASCFVNNYKLHAGTCAIILEMTQMPNKLWQRVDPNFFFGSPHPFSVGCPQGDDEAQNIEQPIVLHGFASCLAQCPTFLTPAQLIDGLDAVRNACFEFINPRSGGLHPQPAEWGDPVPKFGPAKWVDVGQTHVAPWLSIKGWYGPGDPINSMYACVLPCVGLFRTSRSPDAILQRSKFLWVPHPEASNIERAEQLLGALTDWNVGLIVPLLAT